MKTQYHPSTELLTSYAAGSLPLSQALCLAAHLEMCASCRQNYRRLKDLGAHMFDAQTKAASTNIPTKSASHSKLREKVMALVANAPDHTPAVDENIQNSPQDKANGSQIPRCLQQFIPGSYDDLPWKRISPSIKQVNLCTDVNGAQVALLRIKPGGCSGHHTHMGDEYTTVLKGAFSDETGIFQQGDFVMRNHQHKHRPIATKDSECICLTVVEAPIQFTGFFSRLLNPILRLTHPATQKTSPSV